MNLFKQVPPVSSIFFFSVLLVVQLTFDLALARCLIDRPGMKPADDSPHLPHSHLYISFAYIYLAFSDLYLVFSYLYLRFFYLYLAFSYSRLSCLTYRIEYNIRFIENLRLT